MDLLIIALIVLAVISLSGWGYGTYGYRTYGNHMRSGPATDVVAAPAWSSPLGIIGVILILGLMLMLFTGWRPFVMVV